MKRIVLLVIASFIVVGANAQSAKVVSAWKYLKDYADSQDPDYITRAKDAIDLASAHPDTKDQAKTQVYRGQIYMELFRRSLKVEMDKKKDPDPKKNEVAAFQAVSTQDLFAAYDAFAKAKSLDVKGNYASEINKGIGEITVYTSNKAVYDYNAKNYAAALNSFEKAYEISGSKDTATLQNLAITADRAGNYDKAKMYYEKMAELKVGRASTYLQLMNVHMSMKDTVGGMEVLKKGRAAFPNDINLLLNETDFYIKANKSAEALANLNKAVEAKPNDHILYFARGNMYDNLSNPKDAKGKELEKPKDAEEKMKLAEADYKKSLEIKADYFDALYNLGALYYNNGVNLGNKANTITDQKKYEAEIKRANDEFNKAVPVLEKAHSVNEKDKGTIIALKNIYYRLQMKEKGDAMKEKLKNN
ncbi:MAG: tetratricopeptide repeat protein [Bacteroidetes bacterium]|jgi:tetratricopeptide (TPR) repeat protein|nr:tetratricopeptide repeat protein [Bacteroidota bacterium]